ncbi:MAG: flagellar biosynthesis anti-sigma factor FlgM [Rhodothermales bacterium]
MNISDVNGSSLRTDQLKNAGVGRPEPAGPGREAADEAAQTTSDRVELSDKAKTSTPSSEELTFARNALQNVPELSADRTAEIKDRIQTGYYSNPDTLQTIAERLGNELAGGSN